jgi:hypothetical protein
MMEIITETVEKISLADERWMSFVEACEQANIFHHPSWAALLGECYHYHPFVIALVDSQGRLCAGIPLLDVNSFITGRRWVALPFTDYCTPLALEPGHLVNLTQGLITMANTQFHQPVEVRGGLPACNELQTTSQFVQHTINLNRDIELISKALHRTQRQNINTALKNDIHIEHGEDLAALKTFYHLHCLTRRRQGVPVQPWHFFSLLFEKIIKQGRGFILLANHSEHCLAAGLFLNWQHKLIYKYAASDDIDQDLRPNHLLTWTAINWGCQNGYKVFDFGRTEIENEGLRTFKNRWGADEVPLPYSFMIGKPQLHSSGRMQTVMHSMIKKSPLWVGRLAGEILYKHFG